MSQPGDRPVRHVPARDIPIPASVSPQAQAIMAMRRPDPPPYPALGDLTSWRAYAAAVNQAMLGPMQAMAAKVPAEVEEIDAGGARVFVVTPHSVAADDRRVYLDIHGGGFIVGGGENCRALAVVQAGVLGARVWSVDYRAPPDHPHPTPLDDCLAAYRALLKARRPEEIIIGGASAGAHLTAALILRARDEGLQLPAGCVLLTPALDLTNSGDSFETHKGLDAVLTGDMMSINRLYAAGHDLTHPYLSPLFGDFTKGFPPTFLSAGTRDLFLSNAVRMHRALRAAGVAAELHVIEAASHGGFHGAPEEEDLNGEVRQFVWTHWGRVRSPGG
ncbi:alpha/beta hydrolase [Phenylobacterium sp. LjRoot225]|uniref:alpha/beta hydrolase n=1 Tax=Phenylobacterium sp. LjRoot225 TaxID=3342285 RepID=UPI003ECEF5BB